MDTEPASPAPRRVRECAPGAPCCAACGAPFPGVLWVGRELLAYLQCDARVPNGRRPGCERRCGRDCALIAHQGRVWVAAITRTERAAFTALGSPRYLRDARAAARWLELIPLDSA